MKFKIPVHYQQKILKILFVAFAFFLPINQKLSTITLLALVFFSLIFLKKENINKRKEFLPLVFLYLIYCLSVVYSTEMQLGIIEQKASLIAFPIIFFLNNNIATYYFSIFKYFVIGCILAICLCNLFAFYNSFNFETFVFNSQIDKAISFIESIRREKNYFFSYPFSIIHQTAYFAMYSSFALSIVLYNKSIFNSKFIRKWILVVLIVGILQTLNKAAILILLVIMIIYLYKALKNKKVAILGMFILGTIGIFLFVLNPRFENLRKSLFDAKYDVKVEDFKEIQNNNPNRMNFRVMLWSSAIDLIKKNPILGIGAGGSHNRLYEVFAVKRQWYDKNEKYHAHNQYLQILLDTGIIGVLFFILALKNIISVTSKTKKNINKDILLNFILIISINFLFESMFERYSGISFFCYFYCLFISIRKLNHNKHVY